MMTIIANLCSRPALSRDRAINPKTVDSKIISKHPNEQFIQLGNRMWDYIVKECTDEEFIDSLTLHCYNDRITKKRI